MIMLTGKECRAILTETIKHKLKAFANNPTTFLHAVSEIKLLLCDSEVEKYFSFWDPRFRIKKFLQIHISEGKLAK